MSRRSYNAEEVEQRLIHSIGQNSSITMLEDSALPSLGSSRSLHRDSPLSRVSDYSEATSPSVVNLNMVDYIDRDEPSSKWKKGVLLFVTAVAFVASLVGILTVSNKHPSVNATQLEATQLVPPQKAAPLSDDEVPKKPTTPVSDVPKQCMPTIKLEEELAPQSIPVLASDGNTIAIKHGNKLDFFTDQNRSSAHVSHSVVEPGEFSMALDDGTSVIGDWLGDDETGIVYVVEKNSGSDSAKTHVIYAPDEVDDGGWFGFSADISKNRMIVGAPFGGGEEFGGLAFVYERNIKGIWELDSVLPPEEADGPDDFFDLYGDSVAVYEDRAAVSGYNEDDEVTVFIYEYNPTSKSWVEIDDIIVDKHCQHCEGVGVDVNFLDDGGLFISYPRKNEVSFLAPTSFDGGDYVLVQKIHFDADDVGMEEAEVVGKIMAVGVTDELDNNLVFIYTQDEDKMWAKMDEVELPPNPDFDPEEDFIDIALSKSNLFVNNGDDNLFWFTLDGCDL
jgi:hypothetical protein